MGMIPVDENRLVRNGWWMIGKLAFVAFVPASIAFLSSLVVIGRFEGTVTTRLNHISESISEMKESQKALQRGVVDRTRDRYTKQDAEKDLKILRDQIRDLRGAR